MSVIMEDTSRGFKAGSLVKITAAERREAENNARRIEKKYGFVRTHAE